MLNISTTFKLNHLHKPILIKQYAFFIALFCAVNFGFGQSIFTNPITGTNPNTNNPYTNGQIINPNITVSGIGRGIDLTGNIATDRYNARGWNSVSLNTNDYFEFTLTPNAGYEIDFISFVYTGQTSGTGPSNFAFRSSLDGYTANIGSPTSVGTTINLSAAAYQNITNSITFRIYAWGGTNPAGTFSINDFTFNGTVSAIPCFNTTTWSGGTWSSGLPNANTNVIIDDYFDTGFNDGIQTSFSACNLTVTNMGILQIANNTFVEVQNNITVNAGGEISLEPSASVVQIDDLATVTNNGSISVIKETAPMNAWYEYTYWSSPVSGAQIQVALPDSPTNRRFKFNGQNFLDHCAEIANNNTLVCDDGSGNGVQDDIDDNNNDWQGLAGNTIMQPGVGYATTLTEFAYNNAPGISNKRIRAATFQGPFNNGVKTVPIYRNDFELNDYNWNLIGNPYPSAINADLFLAANSAIATDVVSTKSMNGAIFLWSQKTAPSNTANGNQALNFSGDDYAIINLAGEVAGGDGLTPSRFIPSGQGFFVSMSNSATPVFSSVNGDGHTIAQGEIIFNNSMRVRGTTDNNQFFKNTNSKEKSNTPAANKLWIDLTSDNGVFNQILVGYVNGATNGDDGISYDTNKSLTNGVALYSIIEGSNKKFAIQSKDVSGINESETIKLGYSTAITVATLYKLSIAQLEGDFLNSNTVYLKDNLLNKTHNLSASDYTFTSGAGEFNNRFEITFNNQTLAVEDVILNKNTIKIVELDNDYVQFSASNNLNIKSVDIFDVLGRQLYQFEGKSASEIYKLSNLSNSVYIAKVTLSNGAVITKKAFKR